MTHHDNKSSSIRHFSPTILVDSTSPITVLTGINNSQIPQNIHNPGMISIIDNNNDNMDDYTNCSVNVNVNVYDDNHNIGEDDYNTDDELINIANKAASNKPKPKARTQIQATTTKANDKPKTKPRANTQINTLADEYDTETDIGIIGDGSRYILDLFKFSEEHMSLDPVKDVFIQFSRIQDDELVKWHHINCNPSKYVCSGKSCPIRKGTWRRQPAYLILHRKNNIQRDNRLINIEYRCPNCYFQDFGPNIFNKVKKGVDTRRRTCQNECGRVLASNYSGNYCYGCQQKIKKYDTGPTISDLVKLTVALNKIDCDSDNSDDDVNMAENIAAMQSIYATDIEMEANMRRHGISTDSIAGYTKTSTSSHNNHPSTLSTSSKNSQHSAAPDVNTDMSNILDDLDDP